MTIKMARVLSVRPPMTPGMGLAVYTNGNKSNERPRDFSEALPKGVSRETGYSRNSNITATCVLSA